MSGRVADQLGTGASFGRTRGGVSARRQAVAATTGAPTTGAPDSRLRTLPLAQLVPTRFNPRRNFGSEETLLEFGKRLKAKQLQPAVAVTREAYLALWPDEADAVGEAAYVIANGERRYRASLAIDLPTLEVVIDDEVARSRGDFLNAILSENNDREDLDPIERALGLQTMVDELGGKTKVAEYYEKSAGWVTQQLYLLDLAPELQELVSSGELPVRETRALVKLPTTEQTAAWKARSAKREEEKTQPKPRRGKHTAEAGAERDGTQQSESFTAVKEQSSDSPAAEDHKTFTAVKADDEPGEGPGTPLPPLPDQRPAPAEVKGEIPWADPEALCGLLVQQMTRADRVALTRMLIDVNTSDKGTGTGPS
ncbi:ParB/RepB/Spo0J family partition protein [Streptomyces qinglanensis]|uniref:Chromosome partitioning protein, ParB family n=1 Tax=Streptomyces qinglanensis TaxID=943816 RepID=A0A1H9WYK8_9ACTN|nr:ParB/RepB/Spo0J family partition protein [Streptomyces qinglanensis]SES38909.1 chromosome partitioning protein, ParB family [Streptomyces qinglanensis]